MHILITGASKGIGAAIAKRFANSTPGPVSLSLCARSERELMDVKKEIEHNSGAQVHAAVCDVSNEQSVATFVRVAQNTFGSIDVVINNAGFGIFQTVDQMPVEDFDSVIAVNLRGVFLVTQAVLPQMMQQRSGTIVTISSLAGRNGLERGAAYCAAKFGVRGLMQSLFLEVRDSNIRVMTVFPGSVNTDFFAPLGGLKMNQPLQSEDIADSVFAAVMLPARATISELDIRPTNPKG